MNPAAITALTQICVSRRHAHDEGIAHAISYFLTAWSAWEAVRTRMIRVIIHQHGWLIKDADAALRIAKLSSMQSAAALLRRLGLPDPSQWRGQSGQTWRVLLSIEPLRHRLTHGFHPADPKLIQAATDIVLAAITNQQWLEDLELRSLDKTIGSTRLGSIMSPRGAKAKSCRRTREELFGILEIRDQKTSSLLPSLYRLEKRLINMWN